MTTKRIVWAVVVVVALFALRQWHVANRPSYWHQQEKLQSEVITPDINANDGQMGQEIKTARQGRKPDRLTMEDIEHDRRAVLPSAQRAAKIDLIAREWEATARGETLPQPSRYLKGYQHTWMATRIPIYSCTRIWAAGEIVRDPYTKAGPNGIDLSTMTEQVRKMFRDVHGDKTTLLKTVPWGALLGKVCRDAQGSQCGVQFPIGENAYLAPDQVGTGQLWVVANGYVSHQTGASLLSGLPFPNLGDYNVYKGGFSFDQEPAPDYKCESIATVASR